jgi:CheY-like chemotaxis protein
MNLTRKADNIDRKEHKFGMMSQTPMAHFDRMSMRCKLQNVLQQEEKPVGAKILIVEDNELNRDMLSRRLQRCGYEVALAVDGKQGLDMARQLMPDLILMDLSLPEMDGWEVTRRLKSEASTSHIPIIALTAHALVSDREKAFANGCDEYDTKPIEFQRLIGKVESLLPLEI